MKDDIIGLEVGQEIEIPAGVTKTGNHSNKVPVMCNYIMKKTGQKYKCKRVGLVYKVTRIA